MHEDFDPVRFDSDIALVLLDRPVELTSRVQPVCLPTERSTQTNIVDGHLGIVSRCLAGSLFGRQLSTGEEAQTSQRMGPSLKKKKRSVLYRNE